MKDGKAVFLSSHILSELENVADRIAIIKKGELIRVVERSELSSLGSTAIRIRIDNMDKGAMEILEKYGKVETVDHTLIVKDLKIDSAEANKINKELAKSEYDVSFFEISGEDLEDYFIELVGEKK